jgi:hypothetical protein
VALSCEVHPDRDAVAVCTRCGAAVCPECRVVDADGLTECSRCIAGLTPDSGESTGSASPESAGVPTANHPRPTDPSPADAAPGGHPPTDDWRAPDRRARPEPPEDAEPEGPESSSAAPLVERGARPTPPAAGPPADGPQIFDRVEVAGLAPIAWEMPDRYGSPEAVLRTMADAFRAPFAFMARVPWLRRDLVTPLAFAIIVGVLGHLALIFALWMTPGIEIPMALPVEQLGLKDVPAPVVYMLFAPLSPLSVAFEVFLQAGVVHGILRLTEGPRRPFEATFRVFCYAQVTAPLAVIPVIGLFARQILMVVLILSGIRQAHDATFSRTLLAVMPLFLLQAILSAGAAG